MSISSTNITFRQLWFCPQPQLTHVCIFSSPSGCYGSGHFHLRLFFSGHVTFDHSGQLAWVYNHPTLTSLSLVSEGCPDEVSGAETSSKRGQCHLRGAELGEKETVS